MGEPLLPGQQQRAYLDLVVGPSAVTAKSIWIPDAVRRTLSLDHDGIEVLLAVISDLRPRVTR
jgi:hypothetical protein